MAVDEVFPETDPYNFRPRDRELVSDNSRPVSPISESDGYNPEDNLGWMDGLHDRDDNNNNLEEAMDHGWEPVNPPPQPVPDWNEDNWDLML